MIKCESNIEQMWFISWDGKLCTSPLH